MAEEQKQQQQRQPSLVSTVIAGAFGMEPATPGSQPSFGAEIAAMGREMIKDVRNTVHEVAFGRPEHAPEPGAPLNPTMQLVTEALKDREVDPKTDQLQPRQKHSLDDYRQFAEQKAQAAEHKMEHQNEQEHQRGMSM